MRFAMSGALQGREETPCIRLASSWLEPHEDGSFWA